MEEVWRDIAGFEGYYQVSNLGRVRSLDRIIRGYHTENFHAKGRVLSPVKCKNGYLETHLVKDGKRRVFLTHRLVAMAFVPNPNNLPQVNHKDEDIQNNRFDNLEWCTSSYNANYGTRNMRCYESNRKHFKPVYQLDKTTGERLRRWECIRDAAKALSIHEEQISRVCKGRNVTAGGFKWEYATS